MAVYSSYISGHAAQVALASGISTNTTELGYISNYTSLRAGLYTSIQSAAATLAGSPNTTNGDLLVSAVQNRIELLEGYNQAATVLDVAINGVGGTIITRTLPLLKSALVEAITLINAAVAGIGYATSITVANATLRDQLIAAASDAQSFLDRSQGYIRPSDCSPAIAWLQA